MYPYARLAWQMWKARHAPKLGLLDPHLSQHLCLPWDLDPWIELNNGRTLTLYDLGRVPMARRMGLDLVAKANGWGMTVAGNSLRYRKRVVLFDRLDMVSRCIGWDARFFYMEQSMWRGQDCTSHMLLRSAVISKAGMVPPAEVVAAMGQPAESPALPDWVQRWIEADASRLWPPQR
ncbi:acyl-CoA thioesterase [Cereibacter changlensis]|uniref:acyl-CoA thioesterase n=1 Tax=Cereibacter changlensis TaxID=402884 RepID=UPI004033D87F